MLVIKGPYWSLEKILPKVAKSKKKKEKEGDKKMSKEKLLYVGIDYHKRSYTCSFLDNQRGVISTNKYREENSLSIILKRYKEEGYKIKIAIETLTGAKNFARKLKKLVDDIYMINTNKFKHILKGVNSDKKTDKIDSETIVIYLEKGLLPLVYIPDEKTDRLRKLLKTRENYVNYRRSLLNQTSSLLLEYGIKIKNRQLLSKKGIEDIKCKIENLNKSIKELVLLNIDMVKEISAKIKKIEELIENYINSDNGLKEEKERLKSIPGVGDITSLMFMGVIGEVGRFRGGSELGSYIGLVPRIYSSDEKVKSGSITKKGDSTLRNKLLQSAMSLVKSKKNNSLKEFFIRLIKKGINKNKARIALARKLAIVMYNLLKEGRYFQPFLNKNLQPNWG